VLLSAVRAEQMIRGAAPKVEARKLRVTRIAMDEIQKDLVDWDYGPAPEPESLEAENETSEGEETASEGS
jgi:hypothetical protein